MGGNQCDQIGRFFALWATFKAFGKINLPKSPTFLGKFCKGVKIYHFSREIILGNFYRHLAIFSGHTGGNGPFLKYLFIENCQSVDRATVV